MGALTPTHPLLARLLRRVGACADKPPALDVWRSLLERIDRTYHDADQDRYTLERSLDTSSRELHGLYVQLKHESERQLQQSSAILRATLESVNAGVMVVDRERRVLSMNRRFAEMFKLPPELYGCRDHATVLATTLSQFRDPVAHVADVEAIHASRAIDETELTLIDGTIIERYSAPVNALGSGEAIGRVTFFRDVTAERALNQQLDRSREAAEVASKAKSMFLASMSHELRTPLNAVLGLAELLMIDQPAALTARQQQYLDGIVDAGRHLLALVNDVLDLSKVEAGKQELYPEPINADDAIADAVSMLSPLAERHGVTLAADVTGEQRYLLADPLRLRQILYNLIANALKFTARERTVRVSSSHAGDRVAIAVADQGVGIASDDLGRLFRPFEQLALPDGERPPGTGLGLALTKRLVDMHGGSIDVASQVGVGTTFTVHLPMANKETLT